MPIVKSKHDSKIAYGDITLQPLTGTPVTDAQAEALRADPDFARHQGVGKVSIHADPAPVAVEEDDAEDAIDPSEHVANLRKRMRGEKKADFTARIASYDEFLTGWFAMSAEERAVLVDTLTDEQKLLIAADARSAAQE